MIELQLTNGRFSVLEKHKYRLYYADDEPCAALDSIPNIIKKISKRHIIRDKESAVRKNGIGNTTV